MIKQIWFIRNERKLINSLSFTITGLIFFYSILSIWALADADKTQGEASIYSLMLHRVDLIVLPVISFFICSILFWFSNHTKPSKYCMNKQSGAVQKQIKRDLLIGTNLFITLVFSFWQIDKLNIAKQIPGFGLVPIYICIAGVLIFYIFTIKKLLNTK